MVLSLGLSPGWRGSAAGVAAVGEVEAAGYGGERKHKGEASWEAGRVGLSFGG